MIEPTSDALLPRPDSFASACSMELRRPMPFVSPAARAAPPATPTPTADFLRTEPIPEDSLLPIDWPVLVASGSRPVSAFRTSPRRPPVLALIAT